MKINDKYRIFLKKAVLCLLGIGCLPTVNAQQAGIRVNPQVTARILCTPPPAPDVTVSQTFCQGATVSGLAATGTNIQWYDAAAGGTALLPTTVLVNGAYYASQTNTGGCESPRSNAVNVTINPRATAAHITAADKTACSGDSYTLTASSAIPSPVFKWYANQTTTTALATGASYTPTAAGTYYVSVSGTGYCENAINSRKAVTLTVLTAVQQPTPPANVYGCATSGTLVTLGAATGGSGNFTYLWQRSNDGVTWLNAMTVYGPRNEMNYTVGVPSGQDSKLYLRRQAIDATCNLTHNSDVITVSMTPTQLTEIDWVNGRCRLTDLAGNPVANRIVHFAVIEYDLEAGYANLTDANGYVDTVGSGVPGLTIARIFFAGDLCYNHTVVDR